MNDDTWDGIGSSGLPTGTDETLDTEVAVGGTDQPTLVEWFRGYARKYRIRVVSAVCIVGVVIAGAVQLATRPPAVDPVVRVTVSGALLSPETEGDQQPGDDPVVLLGAYVVRTEVPGDRVQVVGVVGPGLHNASGSPLEAVPGQPVAVRAGAETDCGAPGWWSAREGDYKLRLRRSDAYDRVVEYDADLGTSSHGWLEGVRTACRPHAAAAMTVTAVEVDTPPGMPAFGMTVSVENRNPFPLWVQQQDGGWGVAPATQVGPGETGQISAPQLLGSCDWVGGWTPWYTDDETGLTYLPLRIDLEPPGPTDPRVGDLYAVNLRVANGLAGTHPAIHTCRGAPTPVVHVSSVRRVRTSDDLSWRLHLRIRVQASRVGLGIRQVAPDLPVESINWDDPSIAVTGLPVVVHHGTAAVTATWNVGDCENAMYSSPPGVHVTSMVGARRSPVWVSLGGPPLLEALRAACDGRPTRREARDYGWLESAVRG